MLLSILMEFLLFMSFVQASELSSIDPITPKEHNSGHLEREYHDFIMTVAKKYDLDGMLRHTHQRDSISTCFDSIDIIEDVDNFRTSSKLYNEITYKGPFPFGTYGRSNICSPWIKSKTCSQACYHQGIKIHVSAKPETALKIASIVLPLLEKQQISYKIMYDLRQMRYTYYLDQYTSSSHIIGDGRQSTQAGKFIVAYPNTLNDALKILSLLDKLLQDNALTPDDFVPVLGDVQVGYSGGVFARYGSFSCNGRITIVGPNNKKISRSRRKAQNINRHTVKDSRIIPWPDYMNNRKLYDTPLFGDLPVQWIHPDNSSRMITWLTRPNCWAECQKIEAPPQ